MAGIGFELKKLVNRDDLLGVMQAYGHSSIASTGPWILTVLALAGISVWGLRLTSPEQLTVFRSLIFYNFAFSLVLSAPVTLLATRYLADAIYRRDVRPAPGLLVGTLALAFVVQLPAVVMLYGFLVELPDTVRLLGVANYSLVTAVWVVSLFLTALKDYRSVTRAFAAGMALALFLCVGPFSNGSIGSLLVGFNLGLTVIVYALAIRIFAEYRGPIVRPFGLLAYVRRFPELLLAGLLYNTAIWVDKWIMWLAPESELLPGGLLSFADYESATFLAYVTIVPTMAIFVVGVETRFSRLYLRFFRDIARHVPLRTIEANQSRIIDELVSAGGHMVVFQGAVSFLIILLAPALLDLFNLGFLQLAIFRLAVLGAMFHILFLVCLILLSYFDARRALVGMGLLFLVTNALFTAASLRFGFPYYGYGYFLAALVSSLIGLIVLAGHLRRLPYHTFITANTAVHGSDSAEPSDHRVSEPRPEAVVAREAHP